jgi:hypothetical protein
MSKHHDPNLHCQHISPRGQRCRMLLAPNHHSLCAHHLRQFQASQPDPETLAAKLLDQTGGLATPREVNALLANVAKQFAHKRIDRKDAIALAYLSQLLLCTLPGMEKALQAERDTLAHEALNKDIAGMRARFLANRAARAQETARKSQGTRPAEPGTSSSLETTNSSTETRNSSRPGSHPASPTSPTSPEPARPRPPRTYAEVCS